MSAISAAVCLGESGECPDCDGYGVLVTPEERIECSRCEGYGELKYVNQGWREDPLEWERRFGIRDDDADDNQPLGLKARLAS